MALIGEKSMLESFQKLIDNSLSINDKFSNQMSENIKEIFRTIKNYNENAKLRGANRRLEQSLNDKEEYIKNIAENSFVLSMVQLIERIDELEKKVSKLEEKVDYHNHESNID